jgi:predicted transcriptional regulator
MTEAIVEEIAGFITGNVKRRQILDVLDKNGSESYEALRKLTRMPKLLLDKVLKDMEQKGVISIQNDKYVLTENGKAAAMVLPKQSNRAGGARYDANIRREI